VLGKDFPAALKHPPDMKHGATTRLSA
jgi:hypothetical protein